MKKGRKMTAKTKAYLETLIKVVEGHRDYWPLTIRQVFYQLLSTGEIENSKNAYEKVGREVGRARFENMLPWSAIEDRGRKRHRARGWRSANIFREEEIENFLEGYRRELQQDQEFCIEIWCEKDALSEIIREIAFPYCADVVPNRGYASTSLKHEGRKIIEHNFYKYGQKTKILYFGDFDPSGEDIFRDLMESFYGNFDLQGKVEGEKIALTQVQVDKYNLLPNKTKMTDSRAVKGGVKLYHRGGVKVYHSGKKNRACR